MKNLHSWAPHPHPEFKLHSKVERLDALFRLSFQVAGPLSKLILPPLLPLNSRADELWKGTCFEVFWGENLSAEFPYFEMNFSPNGQWNIYSLSSYRKDLQAVPTAELKILDYNLNSEKLDFTIEFSALCQKKQHVAVTAILKDQQQTSSYWSLQPVAGAPDFHHIGNRCLHL